MWVIGRGVPQGHKRKDSRPIFILFATFTMKSEKLSFSSFLVEQKFSNKIMQNLSIQTVHET